MPDEGLHRKYVVTRTDGRDAEGEKHHGCRYFVLDIDHDPVAKSALLAYADGIEGEQPVLAHDLRELVDELPGLAPTGNPWFEFGWTAGLEMADQAFADKLSTMVQDILEGHEPWFQGALRDHGGHNPDQGWFTPDIVARRLEVSEALITAMFVYDAAHESGTQGLVQAATTTLAEAKRQWEEFTGE